MKDWLLGIMLSGAGAGLLILIIGKLIPNNVLEKLGYDFGFMVSAFFGKRLGKQFYEPLENFLQNSAGIFFKGFKDGLDKDDNTQ